MLRSTSLSDKLTNIMGTKATVVLLVGAIILGAGIIVGGAIMCWQSKYRTTCADWSLQSNYTLWSCDYTIADLSFAICGDSLCTCQFFTEYQCINKVPDGISASFIIGGIVLIIVGIIVMIVAPIYIICSAK